MNKAIHKKSIAKNFFFNFIRTFSSVLFPIITFTYSARILGVDGVGKINFTKSVITYFTMLAMLGMNYYGTREAAKIRENRDELCKFTQEMLMINGCTTIIAYLLLAITILWIPKFQEYMLLLAINSIAIILQGMGMEWFYQALEEYRYITIRSIAFQVGALIAMFIFVKEANDLIPYAMIYTMATSGSYILNFLNARKYIAIRKYDNYKLKKHLKPLLRLFVMAASIELYTVLDSVMLGLIQGDTAVGKYTAAIKINKLVNTLITSLGVVLIPRLSYYIGEGKNDKIKDLISKSYNFVFMLSIPACVGLFCLSDEIILLFSGKEFIGASFTMRILTPIVLFIPFSVATNQQTFVPMGKERLILMSTGIGAITNFIGNLILIPYYAENGAALATILAELSVAIVCFINSYQYFDMISVFSNYFQYWIAVISIPVVCRIVNRSGLFYVFRIVLSIGLSGICYFAILYLLKNEYVMEAISIATRKIVSRIKKEQKKG